MKDNIWNIDIEEIKKQELTDNEKEIAKECSNIEMEFKELLSYINYDPEEK